MMLDPEIYEIFTNDEEREAARKAKESWDKKIQQEEQQTSTKAIGRDREREEK